MGLDFFGWLLSIAFGALLLKWALKDAYKTDYCIELSLEECTKAANDLGSTEKSGAVLLLVTGYASLLGGSISLLTRPRITHVVMLIRACVAIHARRKKYVPSRNSFMQLEKGSHRITEVMHLDLNTTNFVAAQQKAEEQPNAAGKKPSVDSSNDSPV